MRSIPEFEQILTGLFRKVGMKRSIHAGASRSDLVFEKDGKRYAVELKRSSEGRSDRLIPLLSHAILQARLRAKQSGDALPVAVVAAPRIPASVAAQICDFGEQYASDAGIGVIDSEGLRSFRGFGLEGLNAAPSHPRRKLARAPRLPDLFSDLNQWMLKIMAGQHLSRALISIPEAPVRNATQLAGLAAVSVMSASRFVRHLSERGFLDRDEEALRLVRLDELFDLWVAANRGAIDEIPARWIIRKGPDQVRSALRNYAASNGEPRCCLGLFAAAGALGCGFVEGAPSHIYLERLTQGALDRIGVTIDRSGNPPDLYIRIPANREAVFRACVSCDGIPVSDILQVWLDVSTHPTRGKEQAREIWRKVLKPISDGRG